VTRGQLRGRRASDAELSDKEDEVSERDENSGWEAARIAVVVVTFNSADVHASWLRSPTAPPRTKASRSPKRRPTSRLGSSSSAAMRDMRRDAGVDGRGNYALRADRGRQGQAVPPPAQRTALVRGIGC